MDTDIVINQIKQATDFQINKRILREKIQTDLLVVYRDGLFRASPELITFLTIWDDAELCIEETSQNPIRINRLELLNLCKQHYQLNLNTWYAEFQRLQQIRKI